MTVDHVAHRPLHGILHSPAKTAPGGCCRGILLIVHGLFSSWKSFKNREFSYHEEHEEKKAKCLGYGSPPLTGSVTDDWKNGKDLKS
jgi:hypothetical protein